MRLVDALVAALRAESVDVLVNLPDEVTVFVGQAFVDAGGRVLRPRHEENGLLAADGYARSSGKVGVCMVGAGPALAHTATALVTAARKRSPVLLLVGRKPLDAPRGGEKEFDARRFVEAMGATFLSVRTADTFGEDLREAFRCVRLRRGPVVLELPDRATLLRELTDPWVYRPTIDDARPAAALDPSSAVVEEAAALLHEARRPLLFVGRGAVEAGADEAIAALADHVGAVLATSLQARGCLASHPRNIGVLGSFARDGVADFLARTDLVVVLGASLNHHQTGSGALAPDARIVQIDADPASIGRYAGVDLGIVADARAAATAITDALGRAGLGRSRSAWMTDDLDDRLATTRRRPEPTAVRGSGPLPASRALAELDALLPEQRTVVVDGGLQMIYVVDQVSVPDPASWFWTVDFGSIGLSLGIGIGVALGRPDRRCVVVAGDGGFSMNLQELETVARERIPLTMVVVNDAAYAAEVAHLDALGVPAGLAEFPDVSFATIARAFGIEACTVGSLDDFAAAAALLDAGPGPVLVELKVTEKEPHRRGGTL